MGGLEYEACAGRPSDLAGTDFSVSIVNEYVQLDSPGLHLSLLRPHLLHFPGYMHELVRICLRYNTSLIWLLHKILIPLLVCKQDGVFLVLEVEMCALHKVCAGLPTHERILPAMSLGQWIPVHAPVMMVPVAGLSGWFGRTVDAACRSDRDSTCISDDAYRTVRACSSTGAPESTAAGVVSPGSLPSITLEGMGEKFLERSARVVRPIARPYLRCSVVQRDIVIWVVSYHLHTRRRDLGSLPRYDSHHGDRWLWHIRSSSGLVTRQYR